MTCKSGGAGDLAARNRAYILRMGDARHAEKIVMCGKQVKDMDREELLATLDWVVKNADLVRVSGMRVRR